MKMQWLDEKKNMGAGSYSSTQVVCIKNSSCIHIHICIYVYACMYVYVHVYGYNFIISKRKIEKLHTDQKRSRRPKQIAVLKSLFDKKNFSVFSV